MFQALYITQTDGHYRCQVAQLNDEDLLPQGNVTVRVACSTVNYKDGLAITGKSPVVRKFPLVPGIDLAGTVESSDHPRWRPGDRVLLNGWGVGESHWGGLAQKARVNGDWLQALPADLSEHDAMALGTAGYTAMLCVMALERHWQAQGVAPGSGEVLVTGAGGGVGSVAIALLARQGHRVVASTGADVTAAFDRGAAEALRLAKAHDVACAVLKEGSPSCGSGFIYDGTFTKTALPGEVGVTVRALQAAGIRVFSELQWDEAGALVQGLEAEPGAPR